MEFWHNINIETENLLRGIMRIIFYPVLHYLMYHTEVFQMVSSRQKEDEADILVIEKGNNQTHINALAKLNTYDIFTIGELYPLTSIYEPEEIPNNYFELMYQDFLKYYEIYKEKWHELILKRIPARIETHQTFKYRMELAGVLDFQMDFSNKLPEMKKISDYASNIIMNHFKPHYKEERKARYLDHKQLIEEYESNKIDFPKNNLFDLAFAYRILGRIEDAIQIYEELIEEYGERPKYLISKGTAYFSLYDDRGIELVYRAMEKQKKYLKNGIDAISNFCLEMGLQDELDKIREYSKIHRDFIIEELPEVETINLKDKFLPTLLDEDAIAEIINVLAKEERIEKVYISDVIVQMKHKVIAVGVIVKQEHMEKLFDILNNFNEYLYNDRPENYFLMLLNHFPQFIPKFTKVTKSLIYLNK